MDEKEGAWSVAIVGLPEQQRRMFKSHVGRLGDTVGKRIATLIRRFNQAENVSLRELVMSDAWLASERQVEVGVGGTISLAAEADSE